jgi:hypothetical protein
VKLASAVKSSGVKASLWFTTAVPSIMSQPKKKKKYFMPVQSVCTESYMQDILLSKYVIVCRITGYAK